MAKRETEPVRTQDFASPHDGPSDKEKGSLPYGFALAEGTVMKFYSTEFGLVDLSKIDNAQAEQLATAGILKKL